MSNEHNMRYVPYQERHPLIRWLARQERFQTAQSDATLKALCAQINVSRAAVCHWDNGYSRPSGRTMTRILEVTNGEVTPNDCHEYWLAKQAGRKA